MIEDITTKHARAYFTFIKASSWMEKKIKGALKPFGITHVQLNVLHILYRNAPEPVSVNSIKEQLLDSNPDVTRLLDRLTKKGFISRETCPNNRRRIDITLTKEGEAILYEAHKRAKISVGDFFEKKITEEEAIELKRIIDKIIK
ncbi:MarR family transcriptional regulator [Halosquirtibacter laminarini]|uniref:MarR family transcriptional regulator n=1 Tax=Halosquirtibacter laminarini TaxID=3374600 RepID=A0AC61NLQ3_9BACT|nr:MarR family transcriptional regulator [Prolixibacteraceae bacterium]